MSESQDDILHSIRRTLQKIQEHIEAITKYNSAKENKRQEESNRVNEVEVRLPAEVTEYYRSDQGDRPIKNRRDQIRLCLEIGGLLVAIALVCLTLKTLFVFQGQLREMETQTRLTDRNFRLDERAWISIVPPPSYATDPHGNIGVVAHVQNTGKTPARVVEGKIISTILKQGEDPDFTVDPRPPYSAMSSPALFPNVPLTVGFPILHYEAFSGIPVSPKELTDGESYVIVYGPITFDDIFGGHHWTHFCVSYPIPTKKCVQYNDTDAD